MDYQWDAFIAHASEDKESFVRPLANALSAQVHVWYDEFTLTVGDRLLQKIDEGLSRSRFGIVVLSPNFFRKDWPQKELDGLVARERGGTKVILPVWLDVDKDEVAAYSPILAGRLAAKASDGLDDVVASLRRAMEPAESSDNSHVAASIARPVGPTPQVGIDTEVDISMVGARTRSPGMELVVMIRHIFGPPAVPIRIAIWSTILEDEEDKQLFQEGYLTAERDIVSRVAVRERQAFPDPSLDGRLLGWPLESAPGDLWVFFRYRSLGGRELEVARTFGLERPANLNSFDVKGPTSHMRKK